MSDHHHLYSRSAWRRLRLAQLGDEPLCRMCRALGRFVEARVVDHIKPHRGDEALFFDSTNLQSLCKRCHDSHKQAQEHQADGLVRGAGLDGKPLDLAHPWHAAPRPRLVLAVAASSVVSASCALPMLVAATTRPTLGHPGGPSKSGAIDPNTGWLPPFAKSRIETGGGFDRIGLCAGLQPEKLREAPAGAGGAA